MSAVFQTSDISCYVAADSINRYFETEDWNGIPGQWWFGGGTDITPCYVVPEDMKHFHQTYKNVCDR
jgi:coproporphyrinogen III oxidase